MASPPAFDDMASDPAPKSDVPAFDEMPADQGAPDFDELPHDAETYGAPHQQALGAVEGIAQGVLGPLAPLMEKHGVYLIPEADQMTSYASQKARQDQNPVTHAVSEGAGVVGSMLTGVGEAGMAASAAGKLGELANLGKTGANVLKGLVTSGVIQGGDEVSKWMLGQGDPFDAAGAAQHVGAAALFGLIPGAAGKLIGKPVGRTIERIAESKIGAKIADFMRGFGEAASGTGQGAAPAADALESQYWNRAATAADEGISNAYKAGRKAFDSFLSKGISSGTKAVSGNVGTYAGSTFGGPVGAVAGHAVGKAVSGPVSTMLEKIAGPAAKKYIGPATLKILSSGNTSGILDALNHAEAMAAGYDAVGRGVESLFTGGANAGVSAYGSEKDRQKLDDYISNGGLDQNIQQEIHDQNAAEAPQGFAKGGDVKKSAPEPKEVAPLLKDDDGVAMHYPEHNIALSAAKGRVSNYLRGLRPGEHHPRLAFDDPPDQTEQKKAYHRALDIANAPLGILKEVGDGTIEPEHVKHFNAMYPELNGLVQKQLTARIVKAQLAGEKPSYKIRQGLSLLMGADLSGEMTPASIQAAQAVFAKTKRAAGAGDDAAPPKKSAAPLSKSDSAYLTGSQALQKRAQKI